MKLIKKLLPICLTPLAISPVVCNITACKNNDSKKQSEEFINNWKAAWHTIGDRNDSRNFAANIDLEVNDEDDQDKINIKYQTVGQTDKAVASTKEKSPAATMYDFRKWGTLFSLMSGDEFARPHFDSVFENPSPMRIISNIPVLFVGLYNMFEYDESTNKATWTLLDALENKIYMNVGFKDKKIDTIEIYVYLWIISDPVEIKMNCSVDYSQQQITLPEESTYTYKNVYGLTKDENKVKSETINLEGDKPYVFTNYKDGDTPASIDGLNAINFVSAKENYDLDNIEIIKNDQMLVNGVDYKLIPEESSYKVGAELTEPLKATDKFTVIFQNDDDVNNFNLEIVKK